MEKYAATKGIKTYGDLQVWQKAHELAKAVIRNCGTFPKTDEAGIIKRQLIKSSTAIPANIAEGYGARGGRVFANSLTVARREVGESDYRLLLSHELGYIDGTGHDVMIKGYGEVRALLSSLTVKLDKNF